MPTEHVDQSFAHYREHIEEAMASTEHHYVSALTRGDGADQCCIDTAANHSAKYRFAGGAVRTYLELGKEDFMQHLTFWAKKSPGATFKAHKYCGWLLLVKGVKSASEQEKLLREMESVVKEWNDLHLDKAPFSVQIEWNKGTARDFMSE